MEANDFVNTTNPVHLAERRRKGKPRPTDMELNMTAMIDVLFMLILFFLIGARFVKPEGSLPSRLPDLAVENTGPRPPNPPINIQVNQNRSEDYADIVINNQPVPKGQLYSVLQDMSTRPGLGPSAKVYLKPSPAVAWNFVMQTYNTLKRAHYEDINWSGN